MSNANERPTRFYSPWSMFDPPADLPDELKGVYNRAAAPVQVAASFCSFPERFNLSPEQLSSWSGPLSRTWREFVGWLLDHEAKLRTEAPEVLAACEAILGAVAPLAPRLSALIGMLAPSAADPNDAHLVAMVDALREHSARNAVQYAHVHLDGIMVSPESLAELRSAICAWAARWEKPPSDGIEAEDSQRSPATKAQAQGPASPLAPEIDKESQALALLLKYPTWTIPEIASRLGVQRQTLYDWPRFREAAEKAGRLKPRGYKAKAGSLRRGHKTSDGQVEAYADEDDI